MGCFKSSTKFKLPSWIEAPSKKIATAATAEIGKPFVAYNKPLVAGQTSAQTGAMSGLQDLIDSPALPRTIDDVPGLPGGKAGSTKDYMDPYLEEVLGPIMRNIEISRKQANMSNDAAANMAGAFGDSGHGLEKAETNERAILAGGDATGKAYSDAFNNAMGLKTGDINRMGDQKTQAAALLKEIFGMGEQQQETEQAGMNAQFSEFLRAQGWSMDQIAKVASIIGSLQTGTPVTTPSTASSILGAATGIASL